MKELLESIRSAIKKKGVSETELARSFEVNQSHLNKVLKGYRTLTDGLLQNINDYLGTDFKKEQP